MRSPKGNPLALLPLALFLSIFIGSGLYYSYEGVDMAFYQLAAPVAILPAIVLAMVLGKDQLNAQIDTFLSGAGDRNILTMCLIYLLAGAFSTVAAGTGGVEAVVALGLELIPPAYILPGFFLIAAIVSTAMGSSMGTLAALAPVGVGVAQAAGINPALMAGVLLGGAMFGDNLSVISDTTIVATRTQGCSMKDKFRANWRIALPAALLTVIGLLFVPVPTAEVQTLEADLWLAIPYFVIIALAVWGLNVFVTLGGGVVMAALFGLIVADYQLGQWGQDIYAGFESMQEIFLLTLFVGGLSALVRQQGGLDFLANLMLAASRRLSRKPARASSLGIGGISAVSTFALANNTVAILLSGEIARRLAEEGRLAPRQSASFLDIFACIVLGLLPYGGPALLLGVSFDISPVAIVLNAFYCMVLAGVVLGYIAFFRPEQVEADPNHSASPEHTN